MSKLAYLPAKLLHLKIAGKQIFGFILVKFQYAERLKTYNRKDDFEHFGQIKIIKLRNTEKKSMRNQSKTLQKVLQPSKTVDACLNEKIISIRTINHLEVEALNLNLLSFHKELQKN